MADSTSVDLSLLRGMTSFYARHTPSHPKKKMTPDLQQHISTHLHRAVTESELNKAYNHSKRRVRDIRDKRTAEASIRQQYEELMAERRGRRMTRHENLAWEEENRRLITSYDSIVREELSELDAVREALVLAHEGARERGTDALKTKQASTEQAKTERQKRRAEKRKKKQADEEAEKKRKDDEKEAKKEAKLVKVAKKREARADEILRIQDDRQKKISQRDEDRKVVKEVNRTLLDVMNLLKAELVEGKEERARAGEGKENKADQ